MSFNDGSSSVKSLLALLKQTQGTASSSAQPSGSDSQPQSYQTYDSYNPHNPSSSTYPNGAGGSGSISSVNPTQRQLDDLLASLKTPPVPGSSAFDGARNRLIEPFGPIKSKSFDHTSLAPVHSPDTQTPASTRVGGSGDTGARRGEKDWDEMGYTKALPVISGLLEDEGVKKELKKMKSEQESLERRLWAKQERLKAEHEKSLQAEKDIARITRRPVTTEKQAEWNRTLSASLEQFYLHTVLPSLDGLTLRQTQRLQEIGVPGLGGHGEEQVKRIKRIMNVIQTAMDE